MFDVDRPGTLYLVTHQGLNAAKVGISNNVSRRISEHQRYGWTCPKRFRLWFNLGGEAYDLEQAVIKDWRAKKWPPLPADTRPRFAGWTGWTETVSLTRADAATLWVEILELKRHLDAKKRRSKSR